MSESSIRSLSKRYESQRSSRIPVKGASRVPLSLAQQAVIRAERAIGPSLSHISVAWEIVPAPDRERLESAFAQLLDDVEILRTVYPADRRMPYQKVVDTPTAFVEYVDEPYRPGASDVPFDLETQIPVRARLHPSASGAVLAVTIHRVAADETSLGLVAEAIARGYNSVGPAERTAQYRDFSADSIRASSTADRHLAYWTEALAGVSTGFLALDATPRAREYEWHRVLDGLWAGTGDPLATTLTATAIAIAIQREWGVSDIAIGMLDEARESQHESVIGPFANQLVCRVEVDDMRTEGELLAAVADRVDAAREHCATRIERVGLLVSEESRTRGVAPFQVAVQIDSGGAIPLDLGGHRTASIERRNGVPAGVDLVVTLRADGDGWSVSVGLSSSLLAVDDITGFVDRLALAVRNLAIAPDKTIGELPWSPRRSGAVWSVVHGCAVNVTDVEAALDALAGLSPSVVEVRDTSAGRRLDAYVTGDAASARAAHDALRRILPPAAVPTTVTGLDRIPITASGYVDREALPEPVVERLSGFGGPARTPSEEAVVAALRVVLALDADVSIGREDSFFGLGGDSLAALRLVSQLKDAGFVVEAHTVFVHPVVAELAEQLDVPAIESPTEPEVVAPMAASGLDEATLAALRSRLSAE